MALDKHPNVFLYEGKLWVSEIPRETARAQLVRQRAWDASNAKLQRWWVAIVIGAAVGTIGTLVLGNSVGLAPAIYLVLLPVGFGVGAVLGALVNKWFFAPDAQHSSLGSRPTTAFLVKVPPRVARATTDDTSVRDLIDWSMRGYVD